jgi:hypothetical protein
MTDAASVGEVRSWLRERRVRDARTRWSWDGIYVGVLCAIFAVITVVTSTRDLTWNVLGRSGAGGAHLFVGAELFCCAVILAVAATFGPVSATPATLMWVATAPLDRRPLLLPRLTGVIVLGAVVGAVPVLIGLPFLPSAAAVWTAVAIGGCAGMATAGGAIVIQAAAREPGRVLRAVAAVVGLAALTLAATPRTETWWRSWPASGSYLGMVVAGVAVVVAVVRLPRIRLTTLRGAAASAGLVTDGLSTADPGLLARVAEERRWQRSRLRGHLPRRPGGPMIVAHDALALLRLPGRLPVLVALAVAPAYLTALSITGATLAAAWIIAGLLAVGQATSNLRYDAERTANARLMGITTRRLFGLRSVVPSVVAVAWSAASVGLLLGGVDGVAPAVALGATAGLSLAAGGLRAAKRAMVRHDLPLIVTPMGVIASGPLLWALQGLDLAAIGTLPTLVAVAQGRFDPSLIAIQATIGLAILYGYVRRRI